MQGCLKLFGFASLMLSALIIARVSLLLQDPVTRKILMRGFELTFPELFTILSYPYLMGKWVHPKLIAHSSPSADVLIASVEPPTLFECQLHFNIIPHPPSRHLRSFEKLCRNLCLSINKLLFTHWKKSRYLWPKNQFFLEFP